MSDDRKVVEPHDPCRTFSEVDKVNKVFYSPGYPNFYPSNVECVLVLEGKKKTPIYLFCIFTFI